MPIGFVPDGLEGTRADAGAARMFGVSRSAVEEAASRGGLLLDGAPVSKSERLRVGVLLEVDLGPEKVVQVVPDLVDGMAIAYNDSDIVVVDKPAGVAAHPSLGWEGPTVVEHLAAAGFSVSTSGPAERQGIVSRLDVGTSGLMVVAKSEVAYTVLKRAFRNREVKKTYHALVQGYPNPASGTIDAPIGHAKTGEWKMAVDPAGRPSITHYETLTTLRAATLLKVHLETGRTHQIRIHMSAIRHPCVGDLLYGADPVLAARLDLNRQWLHAKELGFRHPTRAEDMHFVSEYSPDLEAALTYLS